ncbi:Fic family protein [Desulfobulbus sp.]|uniref:Fic family protein n=1 Tax=Desulfobulbus sp. TaxID=895 RepID=UPI00286EC75D|nr:Fic family protein [Desulfobulbus sp.]
MSNMDILPRLREEKQRRLKGGLYHQTQVLLCYNSNRIEGSRLSEEQTRFIFEAATLHAENGESLSVDDIIEAANHFAAFDYLLNVADQPLSEKIIKHFHAILKQGTTDAGKDWFRVGGYKRLPNMVGGRETTAPRRVAKEMRELLAAYHGKKEITFADIVDFHHHFEVIHPFQDGNGRVGRLIVFKECLQRAITPFIINEEHKVFYYRGLALYSKESDWLLDTCRSAQDRYAAMIEYFYPTTAKGSQS